MLPENARFVILGWRECATIVAIHAGGIRHVDGSVRRRMMHTTILDLQKMKLRGERIPMVTAYDYTSAQIVDRAGIPIILVGDSLGMVVLGHASTIPVTLEEILHHTRAVVRGSQNALIVGDLPFLTYTTVEQAVHSAGRLLQEAGAHAVKLEGGAPVLPTMR